MTEVLSPAGSIDCFYAAINGGADAVYLGLDKFSARKNAQNFTTENLPFFVDYAHILGVKVYVAINTLIKDSELEEFFEYANFCYNVGVDAVIVQDMFLGKYLKKLLPDLELHLSTQAGVNNVYGARLAKEYGFSRVVLARETPIEEIKKITQIIETEAFVQGALCTAFSGQCYLSGFAGNLSGNRGACKQPCRKLYRVTGGGRDKEGYLISLADLSLGEKIFELKDAGVSSYKIEGRMRKSSYTYHATKYYRDLFDGKSPSISPLTRTFNRGDYTLGLGFGQDKNLISDKIQNHKGQKIGTITAVKGDTLTAKTDHKLIIGDSGKIVFDGKEVGNFTVSADGKIMFKGVAKVGYNLNLTTDIAVDKEPLMHKRTLPIDIFAALLVDSKPKLYSNINGQQIEYEGDFVLEKAKNQPMSASDIENGLKKADTLPLDITAHVETDGVFIAKSQLNKLRREFLEKVVSTLSPKHNHNFTGYISPAVNKLDGVNRTIIIDRDFSDISEFDFDFAVFSPDDYLNQPSYDKFFTDLSGHKSKKYLYLFGKMSQKELDSVYPFIDRFDGLYVDGYYGISLKKWAYKPIILGTGANVYNKAALSEAQKEAEIVVLSKELDKSFLLNNADAFYYAAGAIKVMDLCYCPFKKDCKNCTKQAFYTLSDGTRDFILRRVKILDCRFELYNCATLLTDYAGNKIFNLITLSKAQKQAILSSKTPLDSKKCFTSYTLGHHNKGLE